MTSFMRNLESVLGTPGDISKQTTHAVMCLEFGIDYSPNLCIYSLVARGFNRKVNAF